MIHKELEQTGGKLTRLMAATIGQDDLSRTVAKLRELQHILENRYFFRFIDYIYNYLFNTTETGIYHAIH